MTEETERTSTLVWQVWTGCRIASVGPERVVFETPGFSAHLVAVARTGDFPDQDDMRCVGDNVYDIEVRADGAVLIERV